MPFNYYVRNDFTPIFIGISLRAEVHFTPIFIGIPSYFLHSVLE